MSRMNSTEAPTVNPQQTLFFAGDLGSIRSLDPAEAYEIDSFLVVGNLYETLVSYNPTTMELEGVLATAWDVQQTDNTWIITFTLDQQATFASGNPVTSDDVLFSWQRVIEHDTLPAFLFTDIAGLTPEHMRAVDPHTVEVQLPASSNPQVFLSILSFSVAAVMDRDVAEEHADDQDGSSWLNEQSAGSGPYTLERWDRDERIVLAASPTYWREDMAPTLDHVILLDIADQTDLQALLASGEVDIVQDLTTKQAESLASAADVQVQTVETLDLVYIGMNTDDPILGKSEVREAIRYAINYDDLNMLLHEQAILTQEIIPAGIAGHTGLRPFEHDPEQAQMLLEQAGVSEGTELECLVPTGSAPGGVEWRTLAAKLQSDLEQVGITLHAHQTDQLLETYRAQQHQIVMTVWSPDFPDPDANVTPFTDAEAHSIAWRNQWKVPDLARRAKEAAGEQDSAQRLEQYEAITEEVLHEGPYVVLYQPSRLFGIRTSIEGFTYAAADTPSISFNMLRKTSTP
jgi:peptide/nickel transport system substrate-binding protein